MREERSPEDQIDRYAGPYERWVFSKELGYDFAFPAIRRNQTQYVAAILEGGVDPQALADASVRVPPLWLDDNKPPAVTPIIMPNNTPLDDRPDDRPDAQLARRFAALKAGELQPRVRINMPMPDATWVKDYAPDTLFENWRAPAQPPKAIIGVIDDGLPFAHRAFVGSKGQSRISHVWLQSARAKDRDAIPFGSDTVPLVGDAVPFGRELRNGDIDDLREICGTDERLIYRRSGAIDPDLEEIGLNLDRHATHGACIAGLAAGNDPRFQSFPPGDDPWTLGDDIPIIAVQLPNTIAWDTSGFGKEMYMLSALHYIFHRAKAIADYYKQPNELPLVVNFSYGWSASRHDGKSDMETAIEELLQARVKQQPKSAIVMPTGNNFDKAMHAQFTKTDMVDGVAKIGWRLHPDDRTSSYLEIWLPEGFDPTGWSVRVTPPQGSQLTAGSTIAIEADDSISQVGDRRRFTELEMGDKIIGQLSVDENRGDRWRVLLAMIPTTYVRDSNRCAPAGLWQIEIISGSGSPLVKDQSLDLWVQRDDDPTLMGSGGRQSRLEAKDERAHELGIVRGYGCLNGIASSPSTIRVAGRIATTNGPAPYSGAGGLKRLESDKVVPWGVPPTISAVSEDGYMRPGLLSIGSMSGSGARLAGTSTAAASASRLMVRNAANGSELLSGLDDSEPNDDQMRLNDSSHCDPSVPKIASETRHEARLNSKQVPAFSQQG